MANCNDVLKIAEGEVGYSAALDPERGSKYGRWMAELFGEDWLAGPSTDIWWCCMFVSWVLDQAGQECVGFPSYNTDIVLSRGPKLVAREDALPGDIIIWDWDSNGATDHIGFVFSHRVGELGNLWTIEGNYRNSVARVNRSDVWNKVTAVIRPPYDGSENWETRPSTKGTNRENANRYPDSIKSLQRFLTRKEYYSGLIDGKLDFPTSLTVLALQQYLSDEGFYDGLKDGKLDNDWSMTVQALQVWLTRSGLFTGACDGFIDRDDSWTMESLLRL